MKGCWITLLSNHQNQFGHVHTIEMGYHDVVSEVNHAHRWRNLGQNVIKSWLCLVGSAVGTNSKVVEFLG
jgi:hypothetical protein